MNFTDGPLEPPDPPEITCPHCGEDEDIENVSYNKWRCLQCNDVFESIWEERDY